MDDQEPRGKTPIGWIVFALVIALVVAATCAGGVSAQERSPEPSAPNIILSAVRCDPRMAVRVWNQSSEAMTQPAYFLWEGQSTYGTIPPILAGFSVYEEHPTARRFLLMYFDNVTGQPYTAEVGCYRAYMPVLVEGVQP